MLNASSQTNYHYKFIIASWTVTKDKAETAAALNKCIKFCLELKSGVQTRELQSEE